MKTTHSADTEADALNAPSLTPDQVTAQKLAEQWGIRIADIRKWLPKKKEHREQQNAAVAQLKLCRDDLQAAFGLDSLGAQAGAHTPSEPEHKLT